MRKALLCPTPLALSDAAPDSDAPWLPDLGNGRYANPVLAGDYSDLDVVRVGDDYYLTASSFTNVPGLPILHSRDLVNWTLVGHALPRIDPKGHHAPRRGGGVWAPAIVHRGDHFMIYYPDPDFGIFVVTASPSEGPWSKPMLVDAAKGAIDPAPSGTRTGPPGWPMPGQGAARASAM